MFLFSANLGFNPLAKASSEIKVSTAPIEIAPCPVFNEHAPSHNTSCGQILPKISGKGDV